MTALAVSLLRALDRADCIICSLPLLATRWRRVLASLAGLLAAALLLAG